MQHKKGRMNSNPTYFLFYEIHLYLNNIFILTDLKLITIPKLYIPSTPNNSNVTHTFMCLGRTGRFGQR